MKKIFISSVQKEFAEERKLLKRYISKNPAYRRLFDTFVLRRMLLLQIGVLMRFILMNYASVMFISG